ncbi:MAG: fluoride efflux transporter CrcB [Alphaproteobacteria bacterium]|nr:fluoride efflux transporter CrcB [Alphaproteobacteria bacterium]
MQTILAIAAGGALGAVLRHGVNSLFAGPFPWGIMLCNVAGSFAMGVLIALFANVWDVPPAVKAFMTVGLLGGFTTFSTFSMDAVLLWERGAIAQAAFYTLGSVTLSIAGLVAGLMMVRTLT